MSPPLDYKELIYSKDGLLVVQIKKGYYQLRHHSGLSPFLKCFRSKDVAMQAFDAIFPLADWKKPDSYFLEKVTERKRLDLRAKVERAVEHLKSFKMPEED
jgi:hypothetical protein